ncbi:MAG: hypothetical protein M3Q79_02710 [bacterium]|nr:hypothetical protein [bacterium]
MDKNPNSPNLYEGSRDDIRDLYGNRKNPATDYGNRRPIGGDSLLQGVTEPTTETSRDLVQGSLFDLPEAVDVGLTDQADATPAKVIPEEAREAIDRLKSRRPGSLTAEQLNEISVRAATRALDERLKGK